LLRFSKKRKEGGGRVWGQSEAKAPALCVCVCIILWFEYGKDVI
jgi:hypothetical protein